MPERIDVLTTKVGGGGKFTVNIGVAAVDLIPLVPLAPTTMYTADGFSRFERGDNFIILSAGFYLPHGFTMAGHAVDPIHAVTYLTAREAVSGTVHGLTQVGNNARITNLFENYEMSLGVFVDTEETLIDEDFIIQCNFPQGTNVGPYPQVSMLNAPVLVNGDTLEATPFIKVLHNFELVS